MGLKIFIIIYCFSVLFLSCQSNEKSISVLTLDESTLFVCDESKVVEKEDIKISELVEDLNIVHLDNKDDAFFKLQWMSFSERYICIWQSNNGPVKLFDKTGRYISDLGGVGQGPGEYRSIYNVLIDEDKELVYLASFVDKSILKYDLQGKYIEKNSFSNNLNKPKLFLNPDSTISIVHLCFKDRGDDFVAANFHPSNSDNIRYTYVKELATNIKDQRGANTGFNQEIWSYRNTENFSFMLTSTDTLYHYNSISNEVNACFALKMDPDKKGDSYFVFNELPNHYLAFIVGREDGTILVNKHKQTASRVRFIYDSLCDLEIFPRFQDGYFFDMYEPAVLKEKLEEHLESGSYSDSQAKKAKDLISSLNENDNNVLIYGKLKKK